MPWTTDGWSKERDGKRLSPGPAIEAPGTGYHLIDYLVPAQKAVDAFDSLINERSSDTDWKRLADQCLSIKDIWEESTPYVEVKSSREDESQSARDFWIMARGLVMQRMSPSDLVQTLDILENRKIQDRLRLYFFADNWEGLPDKARRSLISADREFQNAHGRRPILFDHLRHVVRAIVEEKIWKRYR